MPPKGMQGMKSQAKERDLEQCLLKTRDSTGVVAESGAANGEGGYNSRCICGCLEFPAHWPFEPYSKRIVDIGQPVLYWLAVFIVHWNFCSLAQLPHTKPIRRHGQVVIPPTISQIFIFWDVMFMKRATGLATGLVALASFLRIDQPHANEKVRWDDLENVIQHVTLKLTHKVLEFQVIGIFLVELLHCSSEDFCTPTHHNETDYGNYHAAALSVVILASLYGALKSGYAANWLFKVRDDGHRPFAIMLGFVVINELFAIFMFVLFQIQLMVKDLDHDSQICKEARAGNWSSFNAGSASSIEAETDSLLMLLAQLLFRCTLDVCLCSGIMTPNIAAFVATIVSIASAAHGSYFAAGGLMFFWVLVIWFLRAEGVECKLSV